MSYITIDEGADKNVATHLINTDENIQRFSRDMSFVVFQSVASAISSSGTESSWFYTNDIEYIYVKSLYSLNSESATIRITSKDYDSNITYSDEYTLTNTAIAESTKYLGQTLKISVLGLYEVCIRLTSTLSGTVDIYLGGISGSVI